MIEKQTSGFLKKIRSSQTLALLILIVLMASLLIMNYRSQRIGQQKSTQRLQSEVDGRGQRLQLQLRGILSNVERLTLSREIDGFFKNRALGMSMKYGLKASLANVRRLLENEAGLLRLGKNPIYQQLTLFDLSGEVLIGWPSTPALSAQSLHPFTAQTELISDQGTLIIQAPVYSSAAIHGYIQAIVPYTVLDERGNQPFSRTFISHHQSIVYPHFTPQPGAPIPEVLSPLKIESDNLLASALFSSDKISRPLLFFSALDSFPFTIYQLEDADRIYAHHSPFLLLLVLVFFSATIVFFTLRQLRFSTRNEVLRSTLQEAQQREAALAKKNRELELVVSATELGTWLWHVESGAIVVNQQWYAMLGYEPEELPATVDSWRQLIHPADREFVEKALSEHLSAKTLRYVADHRLRHKSGRWVWVRDVGQVFSRNAQGQPLQVMGIHLDITELKNALRQAEKNRREADSVIANFLDSLLVVNQELTVKRINHATCALLGCDEEALIGKPVSRLFKEPEVLVNSYFGFPQHPRYRQQAELRNIELNFWRCDGTEVPVSVNLARLMNNRGETIGVIAGAKDISTQKNMLREADGQRLFIEKVLNIVPGGLLILDNDFAIVQANQTYDQLIQQWSETYHLQALELGKEILAKLAQQMATTLCGELCIHTSRGEFYVGFYASCSCQEGDISRVIFLHDVSERHRAEAARKMQSTVLEQTSEAVIVTDVRGTIRYANKAAVGLCGYPLIEILGKKTSLFKSGIQKRDFYRHLWEKILAGEVWTGVLQNRKKDGALFEVESSITPVRNEQGELINFVSLWRDVSHERSLQRQLFQAQKLEAIGQLAAGVAHEINTPIQYIQNNLTFFQDSFNEMDELLDDLQAWIDSPGGDDNHWQPRVRKHFDHCDMDFLRTEIPQAIQEALKGIQQVARIVSAMKEFSHPGSAEKSATDLNKVIDSTVTVSRNEWKYVAELEMDLDPELPLLSCNPGSWSQVFLNLIINSAHAIEQVAATQTAPGKILIKTQRIVNGIEITVTDSGCGIPEKIKDRIFEPFFTTKEVGKGTGQGLAIVHDLVVNKHGGSLDFKSEAGQGTTFTIQIPLIAEGA